MNDTQHAVIQLQKFMTEHSGVDFNAAFEQIQQESKKQSLKQFENLQKDDDGKIMVPMPFKNGTTTPEWCSNVAKALIESNAPVYNMDGTPVYITEKSNIILLNPNSFISTIEKYVTPCAMKSKDDSTMVYQPIKEPLAKITIHSEEFLETIPEIKRIHHQITPALLENGSFHINKKGYDPVSKIYTLHSAVDYNQDLPIKDAIRIWRDWHKEFPFADLSGSDSKDFLTHTTSRSFAVHTCAAIAMFAGAMYPIEAARLGYIYTSNSQRSGKSLLAEIALCITNNQVGNNEWAYKDTDMRKILDPIVHSRSLFAYFDNLRGEIKSIPLETFISNSTWNYRPFHTQSNVSKTNVATVFITGNSLKWNLDIGSRVLVCDLNLTDSNPQSRTISRQISKYDIQAPENRAELLACLMAFCKNWIHNKRPTPKKTRQGFHQSTSIITGIVSLLGFGDPLADRPDDIFGGGDENTQDVYDFIEAIAEKVNDHQPKGEILWHEIINILVERNSFESFLDAKDESYYKETPEGRVLIKKYKLTQSANRRLSSILNKDYGGRIFTLKNGKKIKWDSRGKKRSKKYTFELVK